MAQRWLALGLLLVVAHQCTASSSSSPLVISEQQGNSSFECIASQRCVPCALAQKENDDVYHCSATGYYMPYKCVSVTRQDEEGAPRKAASARQQDSSSSNIFHIYRSCVPSVPEDRLSVVGFEGIMLGLLAVFSPVLYLRKKRGFVPSGMTRIPSSTRF